MSSADDGSSQIFAVATRIAQLDQNGYVPVGASVFVTEKLIKATLTPVKETGVDLVTINANGDMSDHYKHPDMIKYWTVQLDLVTPDNYVENLLTGGTILSNNATALTTPTGLTVTPSTTGGQLAAGNYGYRVSACNQLGETLACAEVVGTVASGTTGSNALTWTAVTGAVYYKIYGRTEGAEQFLAIVGDGAITWTDTGVIVPNGSLPSSNTTAGPGNYGFADPNLGSVGQPNGVSLEFWAKAILKGKQATYLPYFWWALPLCNGFIREASDVTDARFANTYTGQAYENPNWGAGPNGDWPVASTQVRQRVRAGAATVPAPGLVTAGAYS